MTTRKIYGSTYGPFLYDDTLLVDDPDGDFLDMLDHASVTDGGHVLAFADFLDSDHTNLLKLFWDENDAVDRELGIKLIGGNRTLTIEADAIVDQDLSQDAAPTFGGLTKVGDASNYMTVASDGEINLVGTARVEQFVESLPISGKGANAPTERTDEAPFLSWTFAVNDDTHQSFEAPYDMDYTDVCKIKIHWYTSVDQTDDEVQWQASWNAIPEAGGEAINAGATTDVSGDVSCPTQWHVKETLIETVPAASIAQDDIIGIDITRIAIDDGTNPAVGSIHVLTIEFEYYMNKLGEAT